MSEPLVLKPHEVTIWSEAYTAFASKAFDPHDMNEDTAYTWRAKERRRSAANASGEFADEMILQLRARRHCPGE